GRSSQSAPGGWRYRPPLRASPNRRARPASPDGASASPRFPCLTGGAEIANRAQRRRGGWVGGVAAATSTSAVARRGSVVMRNRAFRVTPARFLLSAAVHPADADQFDPEI